MTSNAGITDRDGEIARSGDIRCVGKRELVGYPFKLRKCNERDRDLDLKLNDKMPKCDFVLFVVGSLINVSCE